jgi:uncharacterized membrane protein YidH (DUF202 family)
VTDDDGADRRPLKRLVAGGAVLLVAGFLFLSTATGRTDDVLLGRVGLIGIGAGLGLLGSGYVRYRDAIAATDTHPRFSASGAAAFGLVLLLTGIAVVAFALFGW